MIVTNQLLVLATPTEVVVPSSMLDIAACRVPLPLRGPAGLICDVEFRVYTGRLMAVSREGSGNVQGRLMEGSGKG